MKKEDKKLKIVHFGQKNPLGFEGGIEVVVLELTTRMAAKGYDITCLNRSGHHVSVAQYDVPKVKEYRGVHMKYVPTIHGRGLSAVSASFSAALASAFVALLSLNRIHAKYSNGRFHSTLKGNNSMKPYTAIIPSPIVP